MKTYQVNVTRSVCNLETVIVDAETKEDAKKLAISKYITSRPPPDTSNFSECFFDYQADVLRECELTEALEGARSDLYARDKKYKDLQLKYYAMWATVVGLIILVTIFIYH